jgi:hypothetical protein
LRDFKQIRGIYSVIKMFLLRTIPPPVFILNTGVIEGMVYETYTRI